MKKTAKLNEVQRLMMNYVMGHSGKDAVSKYLSGWGINVRGPFKYNEATGEITYDDGNKKEKTMIQKLKNLDLERMDLDDAIELLTVANSMRATYDAEQVEVPEWLNTSVRELKREIRTRQQDSRERRLKELKARREALATPDEKRAKIQKEIEELEKSMQ